MRPGSGGLGLDCSEMRLCQAIIYVVDSTDRDRIGISREEFHSLLSEDELAEALILVYANKQVGALAWLHEF